MNNPFYNNILIKQLAAKSAEKRFKETNRANYKSLWVVVVKDDRDKNPMFDPVDFLEPSTSENSSLVRQLNRNTPNNLTFRSVKVRVFYEKNIKSLEIVEDE